MSLSDVPKINAASSPGAQVVCSFNQPGMHKYGRPFIPAVVQDEILIGGNFFSVGVGRFHFQAIASGGKFAEYDR